MKRKQVLALAMCAAMLLSLLTGCGKAQKETHVVNTEAKAENVEPVDTETIKFGVLCPLTGSNAEVGQTNQTVTEIVVDQINAAGGINGRMLEYVVYDSSSSTVQSVDMTRKLADDKDIVAIIGDYSSSCCIADIPIAEEAGLMMCSTSASSVDYTPMSDYGFSINGRADFESPFACKYLVQKYLGAQKVAALQVITDGSQTQYDYFSETADDLGVDICAYETYVDGETDFSSIIAKARAAEPDCIFLFDATNTFTKVVNQIRQSGWDIDIACLGFGTSDEIVKLCGDNAEGLLTTSPFFWDESNEDAMYLKNEFIARTGYDGAFRAAGMRDAICMLAAALENCGDDITRQNVRDKFAALSFDGLTGHLEFLEDGSLSRIYCIMAIENGVWTPKTSFDFAE